MAKKRGQKRLNELRSRPKWYKQGTWFRLPKSLRGTSNIMFAARHRTRIEALVCLRRYLSEVDPFLVAIGFDQIMLCKSSENGNGWKRSHLKPLTIAEKRFVTGRNHD